VDCLAQGRHYTTTPAGTSHMLEACAQGRRRPQPPHTAAISEPFATQPTERMDCKTVFPRRPGSPSVCEAQPAAVTVAEGVRARRESESVYTTRAQGLDISSKNQQVKSDALPSCEEIPYAQAHFS